MSVLSKRQLAMIRNLIIQRRISLTLSDGWREIGRVLDLDFLTQTDRKISLSSSERMLLHATVRDIDGIDIFDNELQGNRMQISAKIANEKLASISPEQERVLVRIIGSSLNIPANWTLRIPIDECLVLIKQHLIKQIITVENLDVFDYWQLQGLDNIQGITLVVFRGSTSQYSAAGTKALCQQTEIPIWHFGDFDPEGIRIATGLPNMNALIVPSDLQALLKEAHLNHQVDFERQESAQTYLKNAQLGIWQDLANFILRHRLSIKQQHLISRNIPLTLVYRE